MNVKKANIFGGVSIGEFKVVRTVGKKTRSVTNSKVNMNNKFEILKSSG